MMLPLCSGDLPLAGCADTPSRPALPTACIAMPDSALRGGGGGTSDVSAKERGCPVEGGGCIPVADRGGGHHEEEEAAAVASGSADAAPRGRSGPAEDDRPPSVSDVVSSSTSFTKPHCSSGGVACRVKLRLPGGALQKTPAVAVGMTRKDSSARKDSRRRLPRLSRESRGLAASRGCRPGERRGEGMRSVSSCARSPCDA
mmetsp:Transcript_23790/g.68278  ORF Transcript_23790/g.68278 Transcript_23790/m.68278 type:complete len:201 (-) Transcript_23790:820-1422(-)